MKQRQLLACTLLLFFFGFTYASAQVVKTKLKEENNEIKYKSKGYLYTLQEQSKIYQPTYSAQLAPGNQAYATLVLKAWKDYENNTLDQSSDLFADTVTAVMADGSVLRGKEPFLNAVKAYRSGVSKMETTVAAWLPLKSLDRDQQVVCIWGTETATKADGSSQTTVLHEVWFFNKDGKVDSFRQYMEQPPKQ